MKKMIDENNFYFIYPLGFEELGLRELNLKWPLIFPERPLPTFHKKSGQITATLLLEEGLLLNFYLKIPTRILLQIDSFRCRDFPKLFKKLNQITWNDYLRGNIPTFKISSKKSRVFDSRKIENTAIKAIETYKKAYPLKKKVLEDPYLNESFIHIQIQDDDCLISLDTSDGELWKRGNVLFNSKAPIRENLAAGLIFSLFTATQKLEMAFPLLDPMCGRGTFLEEASTFFKPSIRSFNFQKWPIYEKNELKPLETPTYWYSSFFGFDLSEESIEASQKNTVLSKNNINYKKQDFFENSYPESCAMIVNPPYGIRLPLNKVESHGKFFNTLIEKSFKDYNTQWLGIIIPSDYSVKEKKKGLFDLFTSFNFSNGGLKVVFYLFKKSN